MFVVTADQRGSTGQADLVAGLLQEFGQWRAEAGKAVVLPMERTVGDEVQTLLDTAEAAVDLALWLCRSGEWAIGIGAGTVEEPLAETARASTGPAFLHARHAVERAKTRTEPVPVVVYGSAAPSATHATAIMQLLASVLRRRTAGGWEVADLLGAGRSRRDVAGVLGISEQAVSQRVRAAMLEEERRARPVAAALVAAAAGPATAQREKEN